MKDQVEIVEMVPSAYPVSLVFGVLPELLGLTGFCLEVSYSWLVTLSGGQGWCMS